jgi:hypothetical protein
MKFAVLFSLMLLATGPTFAHSAEDEAKVRAVIADWYQRVGKVPADRPWSLMAPGGIDAGPGYAEIPYQPPGERSRAAYRGPRLNNELASKALKFAYDIDVLKIDPRLAKVSVWERGYFYAFAAQVTYETGVATMFVLEKQSNGAWLILAHHGNSEGIPPNKITNPMPDLRDTYYSTCGPACDPESDAKKAKEF